MNGEALPQGIKISFAIADFFASQQHAGLNERQVVGFCGQEIARQFLLAKGYEVLAENFTTKFGEIDLVVKNDDRIFIVEVKTRTGLGFGLPQEAITKRKQVHLLKSAHAFMAAKGWLGQRPFQIDGLAILLNKEKDEAWLTYLPSIVITEE